MSAEEVLAAHQCNPLNGSCVAPGCDFIVGDNDPDEMTTFALHQAKALKSAGFVMVEVPKSGDIPEGYDDNPDVKCWGVFDDGLSAWSDGLICGDNGEEYSPTEARAMGINLLAAADAAEATEC